MSVVDAKYLPGMASTRLQRNRAIREVLTPHSPANQVLLPELCALVEGYDTRPGQRFCALPDWVPEGTVVSDDGREWSVWSPSSYVYGVRGSRTFADGACRWRLHIKEVHRRSFGCWVGVAYVPECPPSGFRDFPAEDAAYVYVGSNLRVQRFTRMPGVVIHGEVRPNVRVPLGDLSIEFFADVGASVLYISMGGGRFYPAFTGLDLTKCTPYCSIQPTAPSKPIIIESADE